MSEINSKECCDIGLLDRGRCRECPHMKECGQGTAEMVISILGGEGTMGKGTGQDHQAPRGDRGDSL